MSIDTTMAVLYAQSGLSTSVANAAAVAPQASLAMSRVLAAEQARMERQQVEKSEKTDGPDIQPDGHHGSSWFGSRRWRGRRAPLEAEEPDGARPSASPLVGNLLNVRV
ncbi:MULTISPECIES: hypothetical protein [unclassified Desulfovibrio]|uniref:hypothetical protein n=1 Tax=unclassified Desulfovibrio TaxID=2593640 RepID=UPI0013EC6F84|nr:MULTISPECIES: hypothetical protein [unclassified Desulfovibrio]